MSKDKKTDKLGTGKHAIRKKKFIREYVQSGNATQSAMKAGYSPNNAKAASVTAVRLLANASVRAEVVEAFEKQGLSMDEVMETHARNIKQDKHLPTSQRAIDSYYELTGVKKQDTTTNNTVAFIIEQSDD